ncbi:MAG TPA: alpha/beta hydrolase [Stellaceae bacterium]|jgi:acetyl esterase
MSLHPAVAAWLEPLKKLPPTHTLPVEVVRANMIAARAMMPPPAVGHVADRKLPGPRGDIPVRLYTPFGIGPFPLTIYFHGGGFVLGNLDSHDSACRHLCLNSNSIVMAVDYRLAPEHPFPAAPDDCYAATVWVGQHAGEIGADGRRFAVSGDSAGGNLAAVVSLRVRDEGGPKLCGQLLNCPVTDYDMERPSYRANADGYFLTRDTMRWFDNHYLKRPEDRKHPHAAPIRAKDFSRLPPAYVLTAQYDPLCDEGEEYGDRLAAAGVPVVKKRYSNMIHAFPGLLLNVVPEAAEELRAFGAWLQARFASV